MSVEVEIVRGTSTEIETEKDGGGGFTKVEEGEGGGSTTVEEGEGGGSTGRKMMPVGFFFLRAVFGTSESSSSSSESDSEGFRGISVGGGGTS